jgi:hypothetical protein
MRPVRIAVAALAASLALGGALAGCKPAAKPGDAAVSDTLSPRLADLDKQLGALRAEAFKQPGGKQADLPAIVAALPKGWTVSWEKMDFDAASGATILTNMKAANAEAPGFGVTASEVRLWGVDAGLLAARLNGQRLPDVGTIARRIDAKGIAVTGIDKLMKPYMDQMASGLGETISFDKYDIAANRLIVDNLGLLPWLDNKPADPAAKPDPEMDKLFAMMRAYGATLNAVSYGAYVLDGVTGAIEYSADAMKFKGALSMANLAARNAKGADVELAVARDIKFNGGMDVAPFGSKDAKDMQHTDISLALGLESIEDFRLAKASKYLVDLKLPPRTETDLMSLGVFHMRDMKVGQNGLDLYALKDASFDASGWHWLVPTKMRIEVKDLTTYNRNAMLAAYEGMKRSAKAAGEPEPPLSTVLPPEMDASMKKYGFDVTTGGGGFGWNWDPKTGAGKVDADFHVDKLAHSALHFEALLPSFEEVSKMLPEDKAPTEAQMDAVSKLFNDKMALKNASFDLVDEGALTKGFAFVNEMETTRQGPTDQKPKSVDMLRAEMANGFRTQASEMKANKKPRNAAAMEAIAAFLEKGAPIHFLLNPAAPVMLSQFEGLMGDDEKALETLNFTVKP